MKIGNTYLLKIFNNLVSTKKMMKKKETFFLAGIALASRSKVDCRGKEMEDSCVLSTSCSKTQWKALGGLNNPLSQSLSPEVSIKYKIEPRSKQ